MSDAEAWRRMVLRSAPLPAWLSDDAPRGEIVLSSRTRLLRNLRGHRFPLAASVAELNDVMGRILAAARERTPELKVHRSLTQAERDHFVAARLVSPDFPWHLPGRAVLLQEGGRAAVMVNEEDHLRVQGLVAGWSIGASRDAAERTVEALGERLEYARHPTRGYLAASASNLGEGCRHSGLFHLIGLAHVRRLGPVVGALAADGIVVRGLFGEASRAVGAFVQVSVQRTPTARFVGACDYLLREETEARREVGIAALAEHAARARDYAAAQRTISLADGLRAMAWLRWAAAAGLPGFPSGYRAVDRALAGLAIPGTVNEEEASAKRADAVRALAESGL